MTYVKQKGKDIVVFIVRRNTRCSECDDELGSGSFIYLEAGQTFLYRFLSDGMI